MLSHAQLSLTTQPVTLRPARSEDARTLSDLAQLDSSRPLSGEVLIAETETGPLAAIELATGRAIADPFRRSAESVGLLRTFARATGIAR
ncbi:MAG TPA: hypothetical protein VF529_22835 [Solirubrobacteraceae bacterium]|jgi:hypothetical protein